MYYIIIWLYGICTYQTPWNDRFAFLHLGDLFLLHFLFCPWILAMLPPGVISRELKMMVICFNSPSHSCGVSTFNIGRFSLECLKLYPWLYLSQLICNLLHPAWFSQVRGSAISGSQIVPAPLKKEVENTLQVSWILLPLSTSLAYQAWPLSPWTKTQPWESFLVPPAFEVAPTSRFELASRIWNLLYVF